MNFFKFLLSILLVLNTAIPAYSATGKVVQADNIDGIKTSKNFLSNGLATLNTSGWDGYADTAGTRPVDGTGGSPAFAISV